jgi:hypothetical protein
MVAKSATRVPPQFTISKNLKSSSLGPHSIKEKLVSDLHLGRIFKTVPEPPFISSPLGLVPKGDGGFRRIRHLSYLTSILVVLSKPFPNLPLYLPLYAECLRVMEAFDVFIISLILLARRLTTLFQPSSLLSSILKYRTSTSPYYMPAKAVLLLRGI